MMEITEPPICCGSEMIHSAWSQGAHNKGDTFDVYYCPDCGKIVDEGTGEVIDAGRQ